MSMISAIDPVAQLRTRFADALARGFPQVADADPMVVASKSPEFGDYQCNAAMGLSKKIGKPPREVATQIIAAVDVSGLAEALTAKSIAGPGFINITLLPSALAAALTQMDTTDLGVPRTPTPETIVVDLMGVNLAKQMHVGHLRSPIIGDAIARVFERLGHTVIRQNHVGDWGLPIAMVTARLMRQAAAGTINLDRLTLDDLDTAYKAAQSECQRETAALDQIKKHGSHPKLLAEVEAQVATATDAFAHAKNTLVKLQSKDPATYAVWQKIYTTTMAVCIDVCQLLNVKVTDNDSAGESSYADELAPLVDDLLARNIAEHDQGAVIVRLDAPPRAQNALAWEPIKEPCLIRKTDGGFLYATTDIAAVRRRVHKLKAHRALYAIDARQALHMKQVFAASRKAGFATHPQTNQPAILEHAAFGSVLGEDGRPFKTRSGDSVKLADLIRETFVRAGEAVRTRNADLPPEQLAAIGRSVGIAALKYADLSTDRTKDYTFSFARMLAFEGDTGPYLLYAVVRIKNILRKAVEQQSAQSPSTAAWHAAPFALTAHAEKQLALTLLKYPAALTSVAATCEPHRLCQFLFELASNYATFYDQCPVLAAPDEATRNTRLRLCTLVGRTLEDGLAALGIPAAERM
jgi:arginyl-tRNA synthetase